jgi:hypothetical protein
MAEVNTNIESLQKEYDRHVAAVAKTAPNTPERHAAMEEKKQAFVKLHAAQEAQQKVEQAGQNAEQKEAAAKAAAKEAADAKKAAADVAKGPAKLQPLTPPGEPVKK